MNGHRLLTRMIFAALLALLPACAPVPPAPAGTPATFFSGMVLDNRDHPVAEAQVTIAGVSGRTARDGTFRLAARGAEPYIMTIEHRDFAYYSRVLPYAAEVGTFRLTRASRVVADPSQRIVVRDERRPEDCVVVASVAGSELPCDAGFAVDVPANALVDAAGNPPAGPVEVKIATFEVHTESMPAPFVIAASDTDATDVAIMTPYGAGSVEISEVGTGRALNLAPGRRARIDIPLHRVARQRTGAEAPPATIPLLRFNREMLRWVQIGTMPLAEGSYSAEVDHLTDFNADTGASIWGCIFIQFWGGIPQQLLSPFPKPVRIELTPTSGTTISFPTVEKGIDIIIPPKGGHIVYTLPTGKSYHGRAYNGTTLLTDDNALPSPSVYLFPQNPQQPTLPVNPAGTCTHMDLYWDPSVLKVASGSWGDVEHIGGRVTFDRAVEIVRSLEDRTVIGRVERGGSVAAVGALRNQPWLLVLTPGGETGLVPREGADLSRIRRPEVPAGPERERRPRD